jgi:hypothetical protein
MDLPSKQKILYDFLCRRAADGLLKLSNSKIAKDLAEDKLILPQLGDTSITNLLNQLESKKLILRVYPDDNSKKTKERIIHILKNL